MRLIECYIENFGIFKEHNCKFDRGLNCIHSENGTGKTTLTVFIASMLYGLPDSKKQNLDENERKKYFPWQGGRFGGSLTFSAKGKTYIAERTFGAKASDDTYSIRDKASGALTDDFSEKLGEELFGIDRDGFLRTIFLSEKNLSIKNDNKSISAKLSDLVGVDGDVGGFDAAIDLLDKKRKFYYKQSGNCEINNVKSKISEKKIELDRLNTVSNNAKLKEQKLSELAHAKNDLTEKKIALANKIAENAKHRERAVNEERYSAMLSKVKSDRMRLAEIEEFFGGYVPETSKIDEVRFTLFEGERIKAEIAREDGGYALMREKYAGLSFDVISGVESAYNEMRSAESTLLAYDKGEDEEALKIKEIFPISTPSEIEISECEKLYGKKGLSLATGAIGVLLTALGIALGALTNPLLYLLSALGAALLLPSVIIALKNQANGKRATNELISRTGHRSTIASLDALHRIKADLGTVRALEGLREAKHSELYKKYCEINSYLNGFTDTYSVAKTGDLAFDLAEIKREYTNYYTATSRSTLGISTDSDRLKTADEMITRAKAFLSRYDTRTDDPFRELLTLESEYGYLKQTLERETRECDEYALKYGTTGEFNKEALSLDVPDAGLLDTYEGQITDISREYGMLLGEYERDMRECEKIEGVEAQIRELEERLTVYNENLAIIKATATLLREACDNMTSRYIGTTRDSFIKYENMIGGDGGEYAVDTYFTVTKSDRGVLRGEECYSRGTRDLFALSLRLALIDTLFEGEEPFIILDDPFIALDDEKCKKGRKLLSELAKNKQILYFTCSSSRAI